MPGIVISQSQLITRARPTFEDLTQPHRERSQDDRLAADQEVAVGLGLLEGLTDSTVPAATRATLDTMGLIEFFGLEECLQMLSRKPATFTSRR